MAQLNIPIRFENRLCKVGDEFGYFHTFEQYAEPIAAGLTVGSHPAGQFSRVYAIVEFRDRVDRVEVHKVRFVDEGNTMLNEFWNTANESKETKDEIRRLTQETRKLEWESMHLDVFSKMKEKTNDD